MHLLTGQRLGDEIRTIENNGLTGQRIGDMLV